MRIPMSAISPRSPEPTSGTILRFWFGDDPAQPLARQARWFKRSEAFDRAIVRRFGAAVRAAERGCYAGWRHAPRPALAYILLTDQFPRNMCRGSARAFALDARALRASLAGQARGLDAALDSVGRWFFYMPMMHSEDAGVQARSVEAFARLAAEAPAPLREALEGAHKYALAHRDVVVRYGRFPHRNAALGRQSTPEEQAYLAQPGSGF